MPHSSPRLSLTLTLAIATLAALLFNQSVWAAERDWANAGSDFNTTTNWTGGVVPTATADVAWYKAAATNLTSNLSTSVSIAGLYFNGTGSSGYDITSSSTAIKFTLNGTSTSSAALAENTAGTANAIRGDNTSGTNTIDAPVVLGAAVTQAFVQAAGGTLIVNGVISSTNTIALGLGTLAGNFQFNGANTFTGGLTFGNAGTLQIGNDSALGTGTFTASSTGAVSAAGGTRTIANNVVWSGNGTIGAGSDLIVNGTFTSSGATSRSITVNNNTTLGGSVFLAASNVAGGLTVSGGTGTLTINGVITNNAAANTAATALTLNDASGALVLNNANTYTGNTTLSAGTLVLGNKQAFGTVGTVVWNGVSTSASTNLSGANAIANTGTFGGTNIFTGTNSIELSGPLSEAASRTTTNNLTGGAGLTYSGNFALSANATSTNHNFNGIGNTLVSGVVSNGGTATASSLSETGTGTLTLTNTNTYGGNTSVSGGGTISVSTIGNSGANSNLGAGTAINFGNTTTSGTLLYTGTGEATSKAINLAGGTGGGTIDQSGTGLLEFTAANVTAPGLATADERKTLTLQGSTAGTGQIDGVISDSATSLPTEQATSVTKAGSDTWTLMGNNAYTGGTTVSAGTLIVNGNQGTASGNVSVTSGTSATLGGIGTIGGATNIGSGGIITGGTNGGIGTLNFNNVNLAIGTGGTYRVDMDGTLNSTDLLALGSGTLDLSASGDIISFNVAGTLTGASYTLATYGSVTGTFDTVTNLPSGYQLDYTTNPNALLLDQITQVPEPSTWIAGSLVALTLLATQRRRFLKPAAVRA